MKVSFVWPFSEILKDGHVVRTLDKSGVLFLQLRRVNLVSL